ncbi:MAG TPA: PHB depolymerase family esterase [Kofleriaceae bacterium]|nr:PHB depolymerase family esterase [Kofleriaceae bacterium]
MRAVVIVVAAACHAGPHGSIEVDAASSPDAPTTIPPTDCNGRTAQPLDATWTVMVGGTARTALVHVPASYDPKSPTPVVIDLHGLGGDGAMEAGLTSANAKSDAAGFVSVHPNGATIPGSWNAGGCCGTAPSQNIDDIGFMKQLVDDLDARLCVDDARVFAMGMSNGGYMSHRIGCELADRFAAIGPVAGGIAVTTCAPSRPVPVFAIHGNADPLVSYSFGESSANAWSAGNGCTTTTTTYQQGVATCVTHGGCTAGADVVFCTIDQGGHQWPGGETLPLLGNNTTDIDATDAIWAFFVAHPKP